MAPLANPIDPAQVDREHFFARIDVDPSSGCWVWTGEKGAGGYGVYRIERKNRARKYLAHRVSMALHLGQMPVDAVVDHDVPGVGCFNRLCVNPEHLVVTDVRGNNATKEGGRYAAALGERCQRGHDLTVDNAWSGPPDKRWCRQCKLEWNRAWYAERAADPAWRAEQARKDRERRDRKRAG